jgi:hypothetical protein
MTDDRTRGLQTEIDRFLAELQRRGVPPEALLRLRTAIDHEIDAANVRPGPGAITAAETPRSRTSRGMAAVRIPLEDDPDSERRG